MRDGAIGVSATAAGRGGAISIHIAVSVRSDRGGTGVAPRRGLDETSKQLIGETRVPIPMKPGRPVRCDYEYERHDLSMMFAPLEGWRHVKVTDRHTAVDHSHVLKDLADRHFASAKTIVVVQDNLNIHCKGSLYEAFPAAERIVRDRDGDRRGSSPGGSVLHKFTCELEASTGRRHSS
jgi:hypothetical protein